MTGNGARMAWRTEFAAEAERDFALIFDHLFAAYRDFGEPGAESFEKAARRVQGIRAAAEGIAKAPYRGTLRDDIAPGLRVVTIDRAVFWFDLDEDRQAVRVLAVFFGGQDHIRHMLARLLDGSDDP